jgi:hypothetical protein
VWNSGLVVPMRKIVKMTVSAVTHKIRQDANMVGRGTPSLSHRSWLTPPRAQYH